MLIHFLDRVYICSAVSQLNCLVNQSVNVVNYEWKRSPVPGLRTILPLTLYFRNRFPIPPSDTSGNGELSRLTVYHILGVDEAFAYDGRQKKRGEVAWSTCVDNRATRIGSPIHVSDSFTDSRFHQSHLCPKKEWTLSKFGHLHQVLGS